jgi:hypothetical protein
MLFITFEPYYDNDEIWVEKENNVLVINKTISNLENQNECSICLEILNKGNCCARFTKYDSIIKRYCKCDFFIHKECLEKWLHNKLCCVICRKPVEKVVSLFEIIFDFNRLYEKFCIAFFQTNNHDIRSHVFIIFISIKLVFLYISTIYTYYYIIITILSIADEILYKTSITNYSVYYVYYEYYEYDTCPY